MLRFLKKRRKPLLVTVLFLVILAVALIFSAPAFVSSQWFKDTVSGQLTNSLGRPVHLNGEIKLELGSSPRLTLYDAVIENPHAMKERQMIAIGELSITGPLYQNLTGNYQIDEVVSRNVKILVAEDEKGNSNWDFSDESSSVASSNAEQTDPAVIPIIKRIQLEQIALSLKTGQTPREFLFQTILAKDIDLEHQSSITSSLSIDGIPIALKGGTNSLAKFLAGENLKIDVDVRQEGHRLVAQGTFQENGQLDLTLDASGENFASLSPLMLTELPNWSSYGVQGKIAWVSGKHKSLTLKDVNLKLGADELAGKAKLDFLPGEILQADLDLNMASHHLTASGKYTPGGEIDFKINASGSDLSDISSLIPAELPAWKDYSIDGRLLGSSKEKKSFALEDLKLRIGENDLAGNLELQLSPLTITAALNSNTFDLGVLNADTGSPDPDSPQEKKEPRIPFELFETINGDVELRVADLKTFLGLEFQDARISANLNNGELKIPDFSGKAFGGTFTGNLKAANKTLKVKLDGSGFQASPITLLAGGTPILDGDFDFGVNLRSAGATPSEILKTLSGTIELSSVDARVKSSTLETVSTGLFEILSPILGDAKQADSECVLFNYELKNGIAKSKDQILKLGDVFIFAEGQLDFPKNEMTYNFHVNSRNPAMASLIPPFRAFGKLNNPHFAPSISGSIASVVDTTEGLAGSAFGLVGNTASMIAGSEKEKLTGLASCQRAYDSEQKLLSSQFGKILESGSKQAKLHPSWDMDRDGINDCEVDGSCDHANDYSKPRS